MLFTRFSVTTQRGTKSVIKSLQDTQEGERRRAFGKNHDPALCLRGPRRQPGNLSEGPSPQQSHCRTAMHFCIDGYRSMYVDVVLNHLNNMNSEDQ